MQSTAKSNGTHRLHNGTHYEIGCNLTNTICMFSLCISQKIFQLYIKKDYCHPSTFIDEPLCLCMFICEAHGLFTEVFSSAVIFEVVPV